MENLISVIMSVHNEKDYVSDSINSILQQSYKNFELIIIDDCSEKDTSQICNEFYEKYPSKIILLRNDSNIGLTKSLNLGLKSAKGNFIARMDADDISLRHRFEIQLNYLLDNPDIGLVGSFYDEINEDGKIIRKNVSFESEPAIINWRLFFENPIPHPPIMIRKELINKIGGYDEKIKFSQDYDLFCRLSFITKLSNIPVVLYRWRVHSNSISKKSRTEQRSLAFEISKNHILKNVNTLTKDHEMNLLWNRDFRNSKDRTKYVELLYYFYLAVLKQRQWSINEIVMLKKHVVLKLYYHLTSINRNIYLYTLSLKIFFIRPQSFLKLFYKSIK